ncbi:Guanine nucleotide exchange factor [Entamoeba marina]
MMPSTGGKDDVKNNDNNTNDNSEKIDKKTKDKRIRKTRKTRKKSKKEEKKNDKKTSKGRPKTMVSYSDADVEKKKKHRTLFFFKKTSSKDGDDSGSPDFDKRNLSLTPPSQDSTGAKPTVTTSHKNERQSMDYSIDPHVLLPKTVLDGILSVSTQIENMFNFQEIQEEINSFRMLNLNQVDFVGKDMYLSTLHDVLRLLPLIYNKEYARQCLFYSRDFDPQELLEDLSINHKKETYCISCIKIICAWLTTRGTLFTNNSLLLLVREFIEYCKTLTKTYPFLGSVLDEADLALGEVFQNQGVVTIKARRVMPIQTNGAPTPSLFTSFNILEDSCLEMIPEQLSIIEFAFLRKINPYDYYVYLDEQTRNASPVMGYIYWHNLISQKNFNSFISVMNGLEHQTIKRLTRTWAKLTKTNWIIYNDLQNVKSLIKMNNSTITVQPPCVPDFVQQIERMQTAYDLPKHEKPNTSSNELKSIKKKSKHTYMIDLSRYAKIGRQFTLPLSDFDLLNASTQAESAE